MSEKEAHSDLPTSRGVATSDTQGQYYDIISGLTFLDRAITRLSDGRESQNTPETARSVAEDCDDKHSPTLTVGDYPLAVNRQSQASSQALL
jgi:hypothetical protein